MLDTVVKFGDDVCCSVVLGTLIGVFVFSGMWFELLMTSAISCPLWSSVYECQRVECAFTSPGYKIGARYSQNASVKGYGRVPKSVHSPVISSTKKRSDIGVACTTIYL